jgi:hypothetical protein
VCAQQKQKHYLLREPSSGLPRLLLISQNILRMRPRRNDRQPLQTAVHTLTFIDRHSRKRHIPADPTDLTFDGQDIAFLCGAHIAHMNIRAEACLFEASAGDGHPAGPVDNRRGDGAVQRVLRVYVVEADGKVREHGAVASGDKRDVGEEEVVDGGGLPNACPAGGDAFQGRLLLGLNETHGIEQSEGPVSGARGCKSVWM